MSNTHYSYVWRKYEEHSFPLILTSFQVKKIANIPKSTRRSKDKAFEKIEKEKFWTESLSLESQVRTKPKP